MDKSGVFVTESSDYVQSKKPHVQRTSDFSQLAWAQEAGAIGGGRTPDWRSRIVTAEELRQHNDLKKGGWMALNGIVYDVSKYVSFHPGGWYDMGRAVGDDGSYLFNEYHSWINPDGFLGECKVGLLKNTPAAKNPRHPPRGVHIDPSLARLDFTHKLHKDWLEPTLCDVKKIAPASYAVSFAFPTESQELVNSILGSTTARPLHVMLRVKAKFGYIVRPLTPFLCAIDRKMLPKDLLPMESVQQLDGDGNQRLHIVVKMYSNGHLSKSLDGMKAGDKFQCAFVSSHLNFVENALKIEGDRGRRKLQGAFTKLGLVAAGTGILPIIQVLQYFLSNEERKSKVEISLVYCCKTEEDFVFKHWFEMLEKNGSIKLLFVVTSPTSPDLVEGSVGRLSESMFEQYPDCLPKPSDENDDSVRILLCGPAGFEEYGERDNERTQSVRKVLLRSGWESKHIESF